MIFIKQEDYKYDFGIYGIVNKINGCTYVGQTRENFQRRYWHHRWKLQNNCHDNQHLQNSWNKYGENNFEFTVLEIVYDDSSIDDLEIYYIDKYRQIGKCYNILPGGQGRSGIPLSDHAKKIIGEKNRQNMLGKHHSEETKMKMSQIRKGRHVDRSTDVLNPDVVTKIKSLLIAGKTASEVSRELNIDYKLINNIISSNTWSSVHVDGWEDFRKSRKTYTRLTKDDHKQIYKMFHYDGIDEKTLAAKYHRTIDMIRIIIRNPKNNPYDNPVPSLK